jgi:hypothetical protein
MDDIKKCIKIVDAIKRLSHNLEMLSTGKILCGDFELWRAFNTIGWKAWYAIAQYDDLIELAKDAIDPDRHIDMDTFSREGKNE